MCIRDSTCSWSAASPPQRAPGPLPVAGQHPLQRHGLLRAVNQHADGGVERAGVRVRRQLRARLRHR
eukprot:2614645-Alexandrium_andersonii.AAC.1